MPDYRNPVELWEMPAPDPVEPPSEQQGPGPSLDDALDHLLVYLSAVTFTTDEAAHRWHRLPQSYFNRAEPWILLKSLGDLRSDQQGYFTDVRPSDLSHPIDICTITTIDNDDPLTQGFSICRVRRAGLKEVRGKVRQVLPEMVEVSTAHLEIESGLARTLRALWGLAGTWQRLDIPMISSMTGAGDRWIECTSASDVGYGHTWIAMSFSIAFTRRYQWLVTLSYEGGPSILLPTDPVGVREVVRLRDIPEGRARRAALKHWVREHYRQRRNDPASESLVREHLRGATRFVWNGLHCGIEPSKYDLERNEQLAVARRGQTGRR